jgi:hypothetical protein
MSGTLFVVATPIGNLEDITLRALRVLREVDLIAAEDTRRTAKLLTHYGIPTPTVSFHEHNSRARLPGLIAKLESGLHIAVVSDAGTPGIADPGVARPRMPATRHYHRPVAGRLRAACSGSRLRFPDGSDQNPRIRTRSGKRPTTVVRTASV